MLRYEFLFSYRVSDVTAWQVAFVAVWWFVYQNRPIVSRKKTPVLRIVDHEHVTTVVQFTIRQFIFEFVWGALIELAVRMRLEFHGASTFFSRLPVRWAILILIFSVSDFHSWLCLVHLMTLVPPIILLHRCLLLRKLAVEFGHRGQLARVSIYLVGVALENWRRSVEIWDLRISAAVVYVLEWTLLHGLDWACEELLPTLRLLLLLDAIQRGSVLGLPIPLFRLHLILCHRFEELLDSALVQFFESFQFDVLLFNGACSIAAKAAFGALWWVFEWIFCLEMPSIKHEPLIELPLLISSYELGIVIQPYTCFFSRAALLEPCLLVQIPWDRVARAAVAIFIKGFLFIYILSTETVLF